MRKYSIPHDRPPRLSPVPSVADDSAVVFVSCVLKYVGDAAAVPELGRIAGSPDNLFDVSVKP